MTIEHVHMVGNSKRENIIFTLNAGKTVKCHFKSSGVDTADDKYYDLGDSAKKVRIMVDNAATITHINNKALKSPITLTVGGNPYREGIQWMTITLRADLDSTTFEVYAS